jgi:hypothetical protein
VGVRKGQELSLTNSPPDGGFLRSVVRDTDIPFREHSFEEFHRTRLGPTLKELSVDVGLGEIAFILTGRIGGTVKIRTRFKVG